MSSDAAREMYETGRAHGLSAQLLYTSAILEGKERELPDPEHFAFNGTYSLSIYYLVGLSFELMLKAATIAWGGSSDERAMREIAHDLNKAFQSAKAAGFQSKAPNLTEILEALQEPFKLHWFRYQRPEHFRLPRDFPSVITNLAILDDELQAKLGDV